MRVNEVRIGDVVRSYDFQGNKECYFEGIIESIDGAAATFTAKTTKQVWAGEALDSKKVSKSFTSQLPGMNWLDDVWTDRIELV